MAPEDVERVRATQDEHQKHPPAERSADIEAFQSARPGSIAGDSREDFAEAAAGGDSRPDLTDPETARFRRADGDPESTTTREDFPPPSRELAPEMASRRSDDELEVVARPAGPDHAFEIAELERHPHKEPKEPKDR